MIDYVSTHPTLDISINAAGYIAEGMRNQYMDDVSVTRELIERFGSELYKIGITEDQRNTTLMHISKLISAYVPGVTEVILKSIHNSKICEWHSVRYIATATRNVRHQPYFYISIVCK